MRGVYGIMVAVGVFFAHGVALAVNADTHQRRWEGALIALFSMLAFVLLAAIGHWVYD